MSDAECVRCGKCDGSGTLTGNGSEEDRIRCPDCRGTGNVQVDVSELPEEYCPWCDEDTPHANNICVECGSSE